MRRYAAHTIGSTKLWLPSRKSVDSHRGAFSIVLDGHCLFGRLIGGNFLYFTDGSLSLVDSQRYANSWTGNTYIGIVLTGDLAGYNMREEVKMLMILDRTQGARTGSQRQ